MREFLPEGDPAIMAPRWWPLLKAPCCKCGAPGFTDPESPGRLFPETGHEHGVPAGTIFPESAPVPDEVAEHGTVKVTLHVMCGECGDVDERAGWAVAG